MSKDGNSEYLNRRAVFYTVSLSKNRSNIQIRIVLKFELSIYDDVGGSFNDNHNILFDDAYLEVFNRRMKKSDHTAQDGYFIYDEETEDCQLIDKFPLSPNNLGDIENLILKLK